MECKDPVVNAMLGAVMAEYTYKHWPLFAQDAYHYFLDWLEKNAPDKLPVFLGKITHDYRDQWSDERELLWTACQWVSEWMQRSHFENKPIPYQKIDASIRKTLGMSYQAHILNFDEMLLLPLPDDFEFEKYLREEGISLFGLPMFIAALLHYENAFEGWSQRLLKVTKALIVQDFLPGKELFKDHKEQRCYAGGLVDLCRQVSLYPRVAIELDSTEERIRRHMGLSKPETLQAL